MKPNLRTEKLGGTVVRKPTIPGWSWNGLALAGPRISWGDHLMGNKKGCPIRTAFFLRDDETVA